MGHKRAVAAKNAWLMHFKEGKPMQGCWQWRECRQVPLPFLLAWVWPALRAVYVGFTNHFNIGSFMEKGLTMRGGQTPVQRYWHTLLKKVGHE